MSNEKLKNDLSACIKIMSSHLKYMSSDLMCDDTEYVGHYISELEAVMDFMKRIYADSLP